MLSSAKWSWSKQNHRIIKELLSLHTPPVCLFKRLLFCYCQAKKKENILVPKLSSGPCYWSTAEDEKVSIFAGLHDSLWKTSHTQTHHTHTL